MTTEGSTAKGPLRARVARAASSIEPLLFVLGGVLVAMLVVVLATLPVPWSTLVAHALRVASSPWAIGAVLGGVVGFISWTVFRRLSNAPRARTVPPGTVGAIAAALVILVVIAIWLLPTAIVDWDSGGNIAEPSERLAAVAAARQGILWAAGGLLALFTIALTWRRDNTARASADRERDENFTGRYTTAISELGDEKSAVRLGGIYALERIAADSVRDRQTILDVLVAFLLDESPITSKAAVPSDVAAAIRVVGRISKMSPSDRPIFLAFTRLDGAQLPGADFEGATLHQTTFVRGEFDGATFRRAQMHGTQFGGSTMRGADLTAADLYHAQLMGADLRNATLTRARLEGADLFNADLRGADLSEVDLSGANMENAQVDRASLVRVRVDSATTNPIDAGTRKVIDMQAL